MNTKAPIFSENKFQRIIETEHGTRTKYFTPHYLYVARFQEWKNKHNFKNYSAMIKCYND